MLTTSIFFSEGPVRAVAFDGDGSHVREEAGAVGGHQWFSLSQPSLCYFIESSFDPASVHY